MQNEQRRIFREKALRHYAQQQEKDVLPGGIFPLCWRWWRAVGVQKHLRHVPFLLQMSAVECGAACLAMVLSYYGRKTSVAELQDYHATGRDGLTALSIVQIARAYGLRVRALSLAANDFRAVTLPVIVHWQFNHFVVVERWTPHAVDIVDPARGRVQLTAEEFDIGFTGVVIQLEPGEQFSRRAPRRQLTLFAYMRQYVRQSPVVFLLLIGASLLLQLFGLAVPALTKVIVDQVIPSSKMALLPLLGIGIVVLLLAQIMVLLFRAFLLVYLQTHIDIKAMSHFFEHMLMLPLHFFQQRSSGDILARVASNSVIRDIVSVQLLSALLDSSFIIVYVIIIFTQSTLFALLILLVGAVQVCILLVTARPQRLLASRELDAWGATQGYVAEMVTGIETIKAAGAEQQAYQHWTNLFFKRLNLVIKQNYLGALIGTFTGTLTDLAPLLLLIVGADEVLSGRMQLGTMLALNALGSTFLAPLSSLVRTGRSLQTVQSHLGRIDDVLKTSPEQQVQHVVLPPRLTGRIDLDHISFRYDPQSSDVLRDITVHIEPGQRVALVGRTGSGKSTLGKLFLGLYTPTQGEILYDAIPFHTLNYQAVRAQFGTVTQDAHIFSGSIRYNIAFNHPDVSMEQVVAAAQAAALHDDILRMPMVYETFVAEGGSALSGGQRQRLALARALVNKPRLLLLDEATSALDVQTEQQVIRSLKELNCTQIIVAHRLSTVRDADVILVMDQGRLVEQGSHDELLARHGIYAALVQQQLAGQVIE